MEYYVIYNDSNKTQYLKQFESAFDASHWIVNHLDMSLNWSYDRLQYLVESGDIKSVEFYK